MFHVNFTYLNCKYIILYELNLFGLHFFRSFCELHIFLCEFNLFYISGRKSHEKIRVFTFIQPQFEKSECEYHFKHVVEIYQDNTHTLFYLSTRVGSSEVIAVRYCSKLQF